ncbi:MAG TPA: dTMP kinase [Desulfobacteraceae bacterium]|nr:dTMP kinase [Desulfobacteraceae bacterium]
MGYFITFEGIEGSGKSTQATRLAENLESTGLNVVLTREPGGTGVGAQIRSILLSAGNTDLDPLAELFLYEADRAQHIAAVVAPTLESGAWVVCDRFMDATTVYQGFVRGLPGDFVTELNTTASRGIRPHLTCLIDCPVDIGLARARKREGDGGQDRFEKENMKFHEAVRQGYLALARREPERFVVFDGTRRIDFLESEIKSHVFKLFLENRNG